MTTIVKPETYGRMGNFLFQAAAAMGYAWRHGLEFTVPDTTKKPRSNPIYLQHLVNPKWDPNAPLVIIKEQGFPYRELEWREEWRGQRNIVLDGYWQSEKYFKDYRKQVIEAFGFMWRMRKGTVSVHVRRGDYLKWTRKHPQVTEKWYRSAMEKFPGFTFHFFSDDIAWCKKAFGKQKWCKFSEGMTEVEDLQLMSQCEHHICSCSTFSWWGAWLNENPDKKVIMPKLWFVPGWSGTTEQDLRDIVPSSWERF